MKTTIELPDELVREVKLRAVMQGRTVKDLVAEFLRQGLGMSPPAARPLPAPGSMVQVADNGLPVIRCQAGAPAARLSTKKLLQLEQAALADEDLRRAGLAA